MASEVLNILKHKGGRSIKVDLRDREGKVALFLILEPVLTAQAQLL
jgi:hypothetical protein